MRQNQNSKVRILVIIGPESLLRKKGRKSQKKEEKEEENRQTGSGKNVEMLTIGLELRLCQIQEKRRNVHH